STLEGSMVVTNAQMAWAELLVLNGRGTPVKREELEMSLDRNILALRRLIGPAKKVNKVDLKNVMETLRSIRDYRLCFPRSNAADHELSEQAQKVLGELPFGYLG